MLVSETVGNGRQRSDGNGHFEVASEAGSALSRTASSVCFGKRFFYWLLRGYAGDRVEVFVKVHYGTVLGDAFLTWRQFVPQNSPTMHFDNHLDPVSCATSTWRIGYYVVAQKTIVQFDTKTDPR